MLKWDDSFEIGVKKIDEQHKELFSKINQLSMWLKEGTDYSELKQYADFLKNYSQQHMHDEEELMETIGYPLLEDQIANHLDFIDKCIDMHMAIILEDPDLVEDVLDFLEAWLVDHIALEDTKIGHYINTRNIVL